jgi:hypothetical protein
LTVREAYDASTSLNDLKTCTRCGGEKPANTECFHVDNSRADKLYPQCKDCVAEYMRGYQRENRDAINERSRLRYAEDPRRKLAHNSAYRKANPTTITDHKRRAKTAFSANLRALKAAQGCAVCGTRDKRLDHHHVDPTTKKYNVSTMGLLSFETFLDEVAKCVVLCASCHTTGHHHEKAAACA